MAAFINKKRADLKQSDGTVEFIGVIDGGPASQCYFRRMTTTLFKDQERQRRSAHTQSEREATEIEECTKNS